MMNYKTLKIKELSVEDRPREKMLSKGVSSLTDTDLIAILLRTGTQSQSAVELSKTIYQSAGNNLNQLGKLFLEDFTAIHGVGTTKAVTLMAALELGRRRNQANVLMRDRISSSKDVFTLMSPVIGDLPHEEFWILLLNRKNSIIETRKISQGGIAATVIDVKVIMREAIIRYSSSLIICHNHPSGNLVPSKSDEQITKKVKEAAAFMEISLLDHIIIGDNDYFSFADEGLLETQ